MGIEIEIGVGDGEAEGGGVGELVLDDGVVVGGLRFGDGDDGEGDECVGIGVGEGGVGEEGEEGVGGLEVEGESFLAEAEGVESLADVVDEYVEAEGVGA